MKLCNSIRLAYFDELANDPEVQKALNGPEEEASKITGTKNYTPEIMALLRKRFDEGRAESFPIKDNVGNVYWIMNPDKEEEIVDEDSAAWLDLHRPGNLPAYEESGGHGDGDYVEYVEYGKLQRQSAIIAPLVRFAYLEEIAPEFEKHASKFFHGYIRFPEFIEKYMSAYQKDYENQNGFEISVMIAIKKDSDKKEFKSLAADCLQDFRLDNFEWTGGYADNDYETNIRLYKDQEAIEGKDWTPEAKDILQRLSKNFNITSSEIVFDKYEPTFIESVNFSGTLK